MITYEHALRTVLESIDSLGATHCPLEKSLGRIVAEDIRATGHLPEVDRSAMDGYALRSVDTLQAATESTCSTQDSGGNLFQYGKTGRHHSGRNNRDHDRRGYPAGSGYYR